jgi:hypothetical protein
MVVKASDILLPWQEERETANNWYSERETWSNWYSEGET